MKKISLLFLLMAGVLGGVLLVKNGAPTAKINMEMADGSGIGITVSLSWTDKDVELDLRIESPCSVPVTHGTDKVNCLNSDSKLIGIARYLNHVDDLPFESIVWDNAPTGDYKIFIIRQCSRFFSFLSRNRDAYNQCMSGSVNYNIEVIYGDERKMSSGTIPPYPKDPSPGSRVPHDSLNKFRFVNVNSSPYCYTKPVSRFINPEGIEESCAAPPF